MLLIILRSQKKIMRAVYKADNYSSHCFNLLFTYFYFILTFYFIIFINLLWIFYQKADLWTSIT